MSRQCACTEKRPSSADFPPLTSSFAACPHKHVFLELHLWMQCLLLTLNRPAIARLRGVDTNEQRQLVKSAIRKCQQVVSLDEVRLSCGQWLLAVSLMCIMTLLSQAHAREYLICAPMTNTALFLAGSAELEGEQHGATFGSRHLFAHRRFLFSMRRIACAAEQHGSQPIGISLPRLRGVFVLYILFLCARPHGTILGWGTMDLGSAQATRSWQD